MLQINRLRDCRSILDSMTKTKVLYITSEPYWDSSMMTHTRNKDEEQVFESYASYDTDSASKEEEQKLKETAQQPLIKGGKQLTLQNLPSSTKKDSEAMNDEFGILVLGTSYLGPRTLLHIIENPWKSMVKVTYSITTAQQHGIETVDQQS